MTLGDGRVFKAELVGIDPAIDVALLRIPVTGSVPVAPLGDSDTLRVGEWVCAIGNPLGYVHSVTVGVVSFLGRKLFDPSLDAFIQTDAAISFGNSGGPLINSRGQVVGMTTAISAQASNIGFAIPIAQVVAVLPQLRENGRVARGYIGVVLTDLTPALHRALGLEPERGALVQDVIAGDAGRPRGSAPVRRHHRRRPPADPIRRGSHPVHRRPAAGFPGHARDLARRQRAADLGEAHRAAAAVVHARPDSKPGAGASRRRTGNGPPWPQRQGARRGDDGADGDSVESPGRAHRGR